MYKKDSPLQFQGPNSSSQAGMDQIIKLQIVFWTQALDNSESILTYNDSLIPIKFYITKTMFHLTAHITSSIKTKFKA